ncbi:MAG TPA: HAD family hydrolase [Daejeonella sp.]|nr:HAD family hydrolase [Daejeonella sp.]
MTLIHKNEVIVFDLDDLLYKEFDFVRSGFWTIALLVSKDQAKSVFKAMMVEYFSDRPVFNWLCNKYFNGRSEYTVEKLLNIYRTHIPNIELSQEVAGVLTQLKKQGNKLGLITDGRTRTQRNKIKALKLSNWINDMLISEEFGYKKPSPQPFKYFMEKYPGERYVYLADNVNKDFVTPNRLGWRTIALADNGLNIHNSQSNLEPVFYPQESIYSFSELKPG